MKRSIRLDQLNRQLGANKLYWFGTRGTDSEPLAVLNQYAGSFTYICAQKTTPQDSASYCLEEQKRLRVDLNRYNIDQDTSIELGLMRDKMMLALSRPSMIIPYRPSRFLSTITFPRRHTARYLGMFHLKQASFEFKPWLETELEQTGVRIIPWRYFGDGDIPSFKKEFKQGPVVLRISQGSGGAGIVRIEDIEDVRDFCYANRDGFFGASRFLTPNLPLSVNAVVYADSTTVVFPPTVQLVGIGECTTRNLGYCGNDIGPVKQLPAAMISKIHTMVTRIGHWLHRSGYLGVFGVDLLVHDDELFMVEVNPRFLASSPLVARICKTMDISDPFLEHLAAQLHLDPMPQLSLAEMVQQAETLSWVFCFNRGNRPINRQPGELDSGDPEVKVVDYPRPEIHVEPNGQLFKAIFRRFITRDGWSIAGQEAKILTNLIEQWIFGPTP